MAKNIFSKLREHAQQLRRNTFHLSHTNNLTLPIGKYVPFMCERVMPGDTFKITPYAGLRLMPMVFPVQTSLWCRMHFFYCRNKNLWKDWVNQMSDINQSYEMPYHRFLTKEAEHEFYKVGGLADYLGIPVTFYDENGIDVFRNLSASEDTPNTFLSRFTIEDDVKSDLLFDGELTGKFSTKTVYGYSRLFYSSDTSRGKMIFTKAETYGEDSWKNSLISISPHGSLSNSQIKFKFNDCPLAGTRIALLFWASDTRLIGSLTGTFDLSSEDYHTLNFNDFHIIDTERYVDIDAALADIQDVDFFYEAETVATNSITLSGIDIQYQYIVGAEQPVYEMPVNPYQTDSFKLSTLPARAYESIFNGFYRKTRNNPLLINGVPNYNTYVTTNDGGIDSTPYHLYNAYWEDDFLTTATPTPQQGIAPLVGVTGTGLMSFQDSEGNTIYAQARLGDDGNIILGLDSYDSKLPDGTLQILHDTIQSGISINDFRNVNALQRWLERNQRVGYKYKDIVKAQFGVDIDWKELDMPEFIGGFTRQFNINQISQSVEQDGGIFGSLGSIAGQGGLVGAGERFSHYCDDFGYIIGIISVVPTPVYSQLLPKHFLARGPLDFYAPDFGFIGSQPITYKEVTPLQSYLKAYLNNDNSLDKADEEVNSVFGYQRAWYDYIQKFDTAHGQFRTSLRDFLINRTFNEVPILGDEFLHVDENSVNQVFRVEDNTDKVLGEIFLDVFAKRPIPEYAVPKLEA